MLFCDGPPELLHETTSNESDVAGLGRCELPRQEKAATDAGVEPKMALDRMLTLMGDVAWPAVRPEQQNHRQQIVSNCLLTKNTVPPTSSPGGVL